MTMCAYVRVVEFPLRRIFRFLRNYSIEVLCLVLWVASMIEIALNPSNTASLEHFYTDHMREEWTAWCFLQLGYKIFYTPVKYLVHQCHSLYPHPFWGNVPTDRPLGCIFIFLPFGILANLGILPDVLVHRLEIAVITTQAIGAIYLIARAVRNRFVRVMFLTFLAPYILHWSLNGIYDGAILLFVIVGLLAYERKRWKLSALALTYAVCTHYRAVMYTPLVLGSIVNLWRSGDRRTAIKLGAVCLIAIIVCTLIPAYLTFVKAEHVLTRVATGKAGGGFGNFKKLLNKLILYYTFFGVGFAYFIYRRRIAHAFSLLGGALIIWLIFNQLWHAILVFIPWIVVDEVFFAFMMPIAFMFGVGSYLPWTLYWFLKNYGINPRLD